MLVELSFKWNNRWDFNRLNGSLGTVAEVWIYARDHRYQPATPRDKPTVYVAGAKDRGGCLHASDGPECATIEEAKASAERLVIVAMGGVIRS